MSPQALETVLVIFLICSKEERLLFNRLIVCPRDDAVEVPLKGNRWLLVTQVELKPQAF